MAKQFVEGNVYVFSYKKFLKHLGKIKVQLNKNLKKSNGIKVIEIKADGVAKLQDRTWVLREWCKCIKENVSNKVRRG
ncbi:hypothetical protein [Clostridium cellulovorans]|jgi:hypothetical protein|uniref:Uncharacterized protein n=1 Tax=Clostridium cellulovorans (strain ATCC 35296 / DSM 3052 / OCM 3 / 743B) TaxID=573061 RepID=D9SWG8_CLOC7|nr:hypothetical protein [Clostridium cellulovorans]ADL53250.1 hypothetical protein Clocel_3575 [Clostridium cellulovorans 743B]